MNEMKAILVLVTRQKTCEELIRAGHELATREGRPLQVLCVQPRAALRVKDAQDLEYLFSTSKSLKAEMVVYYNDDAVKTAVDYIRHQNIHSLIAGSSFGESEFLLGVRAATSIPLHIYRDGVLREEITKNIATSRLAMAF